MLATGIDLGIVVAAALAGGLLNALAGGGSFFTLPALIFTGVPPVAANATGTTALLPGYIASAWRARDIMRAPAGVSLVMLVGLGAVGGTLGAGLLLVTSDAAFRQLVPWLLLFATLLFAFGPQLHARLQRAATRRRPGAGRAGLLAVAAYGGYFNGGMGIIILAAFRLMGVSDVAVANALKNLLSAVLTLIAVAVYGLGGVISWLYILPMAPAAIAGGWLGAWLGRVLPQHVQRWGIVAVGAITTAIFFVRG